MKLEKLNPLSAEIYLLGFGTLMLILSKKISNPFAKQINSSNQTQCHRPSDLQQEIRWR